MRNENYTSFLVVTIFFVGLFFFLSFNKIPEQKGNSETSYVIKYVKIGGVTLQVELAETPEAHARGLSGRQSLDEDQGMLFVFSKGSPAAPGFWMKDMNFPIDIIWLAPVESGNKKDLEVVYIKKNAHPDFYPEIYRPDASARRIGYVLEVVAGFSERNDLKE